MPPRPFVNDALWRCLCPRWNQMPIRAGLGNVGASEPTVMRYGKERQPSRIYNTAAVTSNVTPATAETHNRSSHGRLHTNPLLRKSEEKVPLVHLSSEALYSRLRIDAAAGNHEEVMKILTILIKDRRERPNLPMYTALLHSYVSPEFGTAGKIRKALEDMETAGVELDAQACECVLAALAVHPDSFLRTDILEYMKERWWSVSPRAQAFVVAGLLRERCFEMALEKLEQMVKDGVAVESWLWDKAIWMLLEFGEVEEAFYVLSLRQNVFGDENATLSGSLWTQLLDVAAKKHIAEAVSMIWNTQVTPGCIKPTTGTCLNVLSVASRVGNVKLGTDVFRVLAERGTVFTNHQYEALIQCYLAANDLPAALSVVTIMVDTSLKVTDDELHSLYAYLRKDSSRPMDAFMQLQELSRDGKNIPTAAVNTCIKASIKLDNFSEAIELYKALKTAAKAGPNTATFNELFRGCHTSGRKELAMYLASEMTEMDIRPDRITYDRLILTCINAGDVDDAIGYFEEMKAEGWMPRRRTHEVLVEGALNAKDGRCVALLRIYKEQEYAVESRAVTLERRVMKHFEESGERKTDVEEESAEEQLEALQKERKGEGEGGEEVVQ